MCKKLTYHDFITTALGHYTNLYLHLLIPQEVDRRYESSFPMDSDSQLLTKGSRKQTDMPLRNSHPNYVIH